MKFVTTLPVDPALPGLEAIRDRGPGVLRVPGIDFHDAAVRLCGYTPGNRATLEVLAGDRRFAVKSMAGDPDKETAFYRRMNACGERFGVQVPPLFAIDRDLRLFVTGWLEGPTASDLIKRGQGERVGGLVAQWLRCLAALADQSEETMEPETVERMVARWCSTMTTRDRPLGIRAVGVQHALRRTRPRNGSLRHHLI